MDDTATYHIVTYCESEHSGIPFEISDTEYRNITLQRAFKLATGRLNWMRMNQSKLSWSVAVKNHGRNGWNKNVVIMQAEVEAGVFPERLMPVGV